MTFPFDGLGFAPKHIDLKGSDALSVDCDWYKAFTLYTDATTPPYDASWVQDTRLILKERPTDADADAVAVSETSVVDVTTVGTGYLHIARDTVDDAWIGKRLFYTFKASNGTHWLPLLYGTITIRNSASYANED